MKAEDIKLGQMAENLLSARDVGVNLGDRWLMRGVDISLEAGDRLCLVGRNGAGKSTLMKIMANLAEMDEGSLVDCPRQNRILSAAGTSAYQRHEFIQHCPAWHTGSDGDALLSRHIKPKPI